jgi:hypothetical protein
VRLDDLEVGPFGVRTHRMKATKRREAAGSAAVPAGVLDLDVLRAARMQSRHGGPREIPAVFEHLRYEYRCGKCGAHYQWVLERFDAAVRDAMQRGVAELAPGEGGL